MLRSHSPLSDVKAACAACLQATYTRFIAPTQHGRGGSGCAVFCVPHSAAQHATSVSMRSQQKLRQNRENHHIYLPLLSSEACTRARVRPRIHAPCLLPAEEGETVAVAHCPRRSTSKRYDQTDRQTKRGSKRPVWCETDSLCVSEHSNLYAQAYTRVDIIDSSSKNCVRVGGKQ